MYGRVIQSSDPLRLSIVDGLDVSDSRVRNAPPRYNAAPSQELLIIRENHKTGQRSLDLIKWGLIPHWCQDPTGGRKPINCWGFFVDTEFWDDAEFSFGFRRLRQVGNSTLPPAS